MLNLLDIFVVTFVALATALAAYWWIARQREPEISVPEADDDPVIFLFDDGILQHATFPAKSLLSLVPGTHFWEDLYNALRDRFPNFPEYPNSGPAGELCLRAIDGKDPQEALIHWRDNLSWVTLLQPDDISHPIDQTEIDTLRRVNRTAPYPAWEENAEGLVTWHNTAYAALFRKIHDDTVHDDKPLFSNDDPDRPHRVFVETATGIRDWYEVTTVQADGMTVFHAAGISAVVAAEDAQRNFVQTLAKTFAHLSIGLAIFDRNKQLALFNPALVDLTNLPAQFLSARPDMLSFFDQLREKRKMPEPKNYLNWRDEIADVIAAASDGQYQETWSLETGQTYSVQGRPHPDGATAFLIEDISAEMTLTRNFRAELEQAQVVLDTVDDAIAVFSPAGVLTFSNANFQDLWQISPETTFADVTLQDCAAIWQQRALSGADIHAIGRFLTEVGLQQPQDMTLRLKDQTVFRCQMRPIPSGATLIRFNQIAEPATQPQKHPPQTVG